MKKLQQLLIKKATERATALQNINKGHPAIVLSTWFGCGYMFPAPGFWGTLGSMPLGIVLLAMTSKTVLLASVVLIFFIGLWASKEFEKQSQTHDSSMIVIDETAGILLTLLFASTNAVSILLAFILFRIFDSAKPWPISWFDKKIGGAFGVMIDDIIAGIMAGLCLLGLRLYAGIG